MKVELTEPADRSHPREHTGLQHAAGRVRDSARRLSSAKTSDITGECFRYAFVGASAFVIDFLTLAALTEWGDIHYMGSAAVAFTVGLVLNYFLSRKWVFGRRSVQNGTVEFGVFASVGVVGLGLNELGMWVLAEIAGLHYLSAKIATAVIVFLWNFGVRKMLLYR